MSTHGKPEVKFKLQSKAQTAITDLIALEKLVVKGSKSKEMISQVARSMVQHESSLENSLKEVQKMHIMLTHLHYQADSIHHSLIEVTQIQDQLAALKLGK